MPSFITYHRKTSTLPAIPPIFKQTFYLFFFFLNISMAMILNFLGGVYWLIDWLIAVLGLRFCARAFSSCGKRGPLLIAVRGPLIVAASPIAEHRLQTRRLSSCGSRAQLLCGLWDLPRPGLEPMSPALSGRFSTTAPPGKPYHFLEYLVGWHSSSHHLFILEQLIFSCWMISERLICCDG